METQLHFIRVFHSSHHQGNFAGVIFDKRKLSPQKIIALTKKFRLPDIAWIQPETDSLRIRFFTPNCEIQFCGHATLASARLIQRNQKAVSKPIRFYSQHQALQVEAGLVMCRMKSRRVKAKSIAPPSDYLSEHPWFEAAEDYFVKFDTESKLQKLKPEFKKIAKLNKRGLVVTASNRKGRYALRFFAPQSGIPEDACTGSVQSVLGDLWARTQQRNDFQVRQLSASGGSMQAHVSQTQVEVKARVQWIQEKLVCLK